MKYLPETLVSLCSTFNQDVNVQLEVNDAIHSLLDVFLRKVVINNTNGRRREVRLFFTNDFNIYGEDTGDTALYEPTLNCIIHYKQKRYFLVGGGFFHI